MNHNPDETPPGYPEFSEAEASAFARLIETFRGPPAEAVLFDNRYEVRPKVGKRRRDFDVVIRTWLEQRDFCRGVGAGQPVYRRWARPWPPRTTP